MGVLNRMTNGNYVNEDAVENVIRYITRTRKNENRKNELLMYGGKGVAIYEPVDYMIAQLIYVQCVFGIEQRKGRRMYHEVFSLDPHEFIRMGRNVNTLWKFADQCAQCYFDAGYQVVYAIHGTNESDLHIHFAVSTINFRSGLKWHDSKTDLDLREDLFNKILGKYQYMFIINK